MYTCVIAVIGELLSKRLVHVIMCICSEVKVYFGP